MRSSQHSRRYSGGPLKIGRSLLPEEGQSNGERVVLLSYGPWQRRFGAGLLIKSFIRLSDVNLGFDPQNVIAADISLPDRYNAPARRVEFFRQLMTRVEALPGVSSVAVSQSVPLSGEEFGSLFTVNERESSPGRASTGRSTTVSAHNSPGAGIGWHRDKAIFGRVVGVSLLSPCVFRMRRAVRKKQWERVNMVAEPRSAYLLSGPARSEWEHSILQMDALRYSITFRNVREDRNGTEN